MLPRLKFLAALTAALFLSACQSATVPPEKLATIRTIAVVGTADNEWSWERVKFLTGTDRQKLPGNDWRLGERAAKLATTLLAQRYTISPTEAIDRGALKGSHWTMESRVAEQLAKLPKRPDAMLLIRKGLNSTGGTPVLNAPSNMYGFGIYSTTHLFEDYVSAYAIMELELYDGQTGKLISTARAVVPSAKGEGGTPFAFLTFPGKARLIDQWTETFEAQPASAREAVRVTLTDLVDRSMPFTLRKMGLIR